MTERHRPTEYWLLWCDYCAELAPPDRDRDRQWAAAETAGWRFGGQGDACPACRPVVFLEVPDTTLDSVAR